MGPSFMNIWPCGKSLRSGFPNAWTRNRNVKGARCLSKFWNFFGAIQIISCRDWWPWTKPSYITMVQKQSNVQWRVDIASHPAPKNSECKNPLEKFSPRSFRIKTVSFSLIIFQTAKLSTRSITHLCWCNWRTFLRKSATARSPRWSCSCTTIPRLTGYLQHRRNWPAGFPMFWSPTLSSGPGPIALPPVTWTEKRVERSPFFVLREGHSCRGDLVVLTKFRIFLSGLQMLEQQTKKCIELRWAYSFVE